MSENPNQPREYDAVLGGQNPPIYAAVLGGIEGVKKRLASSILEVRINELSDALKYGEKGLDLVLQALQDELFEVQFAAYSLLKDRQEPRVKQQLDNFLPLFDFEVVTVDAYGQINSRHRHYAQYFTEDLGNGVELEMVAIPGGTFQMGSSESSHEQPVHQVTVKPFFMSKYPITQEQWQAVMGNNPSSFKGAKRPVENVSWQDAVEFYTKLSQKTGKNYRLPSEAEWEYACRAGTTTPFHFGETITPDLVNYCGIYSYASEATGLYRRETTPVGSFPPNAFGLYDMHGNVLEWCSDRWHDNYNGAPCNGSSWETGCADYRVQRGGLWVINACNCRSAHRYRYMLSNEAGYFGFRVAAAWFPGV
jgi:formylglycine-generating enzyme required for sulfatase activity